MKVYIIDSSITGKAVKESSVFQKETNRTIGYLWRRL